LAVVNNVNITYFGIFMYYFNKFLMRFNNIYFVNKLRKDYVTYLSAIFPITLLINFIRIMHKWAVLSDKYNNIIYTCINDGIKCEIIQNNCSEVYEQYHDRLNSEDYFIARRAKSSIQQCITNHNKDETNYINEFSYVFLDTYLWVAAITLLILIINIIIEFILDLVFIINEKIKNVYKENVPDIEEIV